MVWWSLNPSPAGNTMEREREWLERRNGVLVLVYRGDSSLLPLPLSLSRLPLFVRASEKEDGSYPPRGKRHIRKADPISGEIARSDA